MSPKKIQLSKNQKGKKSKLAKIAEILGLFEEQKKGKDWLLDELKRNHVKFKVSTTANSFEILNSCPVKEIDRLFLILKDDRYQVNEIDTLTRTLHWFFCDVVGASNPNLSVKTQARKIIALNAFIQKTTTFQERDENNSVVQPTGDGMAIGFGDSPEKPLRLAIELSKLINNYNKTRSEKEKIYLRIGLDSGPVYFIQDVLGNESFWGYGIIMARRVMDLCGPNQIFASPRIGDDIKKLSPEYNPIMHKVGKYSIKHGQEISIYNVFGKNFGNKIVPKKDKIPPISLINDPLIAPKFEFNNVECRLEITNPKTMMVHHTYLWDIKNLSNIPLENLFYDISGDIPKDFRDLNVTIKDEKNNDLEIVSLDSNKDHEKKFHVKLEKPIKKNQRGRVFTVEYDWEEPYRVFEYVLSSRCKNFSYTLTTPKDLKIKNRILEVERDLGLKKRADPPAKISYEPEYTKIIWEIDKKRTLQKHETFEFHW
jgi:class 3 adenylate cyclase